MFMYAFIQVDFISTIIKKKLNLPHCIAVKIKWSSDLKVGIDNYIKHRNQSIGIRYSFLPEERK